MTKQFEGGYITVDSQDLDGFSFDFDGDTYGFDGIEWEDLDDFTPKNESLLDEKAELPLTSLRKALLAANIPLVAAVIEKNPITSRRGAVALFGGLAAASGLLKPTEAYAQQARRGEEQVGDLPYRTAINKYRLEVLEGSALYDSPPGQVVSFLARQALVPRLNELSERDQLSYVPFNGERAGRKNVVGSSGDGVPFISLRFVKMGPNNEEKEIRFGGIRIGKDKLLMSFDATRPLREANKDSPARPLLRVAGYDFAAKGNPNLPSLAIPDTLNTADKLHGRFAVIRAAPFSREDKKPVQEYDAGTIISLDKAPALRRLLFEKFLPFATDSGKNNPAAAVNSFLDQVMFMTTAAQPNATGDEKIAFENIAGEGAGSSWPVFVSAEADGGVAGGKPTQFAFAATLLGGLGSRDTLGEGKNLAYGYLLVRPEVVLKTMMSAR